VFSGLCLVLCGASADPTAIFPSCSLPERERLRHDEARLRAGRYRRRRKCVQGHPFRCRRRSVILRWKEPVTLAVRSTILETRKFSARCMQTCRPLQRSPSPLSEDCLYLNIWTPAKFRTKMALPVMVYVHGGGNTTGSASETPGQGNLFSMMASSSQSAGHVIVVTIQYRLNVFGYLVHPALDAESATKPRAIMGCSIRSRRSIG